MKKTKRNYYEKPFREVSIIEDKNGDWVHPDFHFMQGNNIETYDINELKLWGEQRSMEFLFVERAELEDYDTWELNNPFARWSAADWFPMPPSSKWMLIYKTDYEDGPYAIFAKSTI